MLPNVIEEPRRLLVLHVKAAVVVGVFLQELGVVVRFYKDKVGIGAVLDKTPPVMKISQDDGLPPDAVLAAVDDESKIMEVRLVRD